MRIEYVTDWSKYHPYFTEDEFKCKHTGICKMQKSFMDLLLKIRLDTGIKMPIPSGYRHPTHPIEMKKGHATGEHTTGNCCDVAVSGVDALVLLHSALNHGIIRIGVQQKRGELPFIHLGMGRDELDPPTIWSY